MNAGDKYTHHGVPVTIERYDGGKYVWVAYDGTGKRRQLPIATIIAIDVPNVSEKAPKKVPKPLRELDPRREKLKKYMRQVTNCEEAIQVANQLNIELVMDRSKFGNSKMQLMTRIWSKIIKNEINIEEIVV